MSTEGEIAHAVVYHIYEEEKDLAFDLISTNQPECYAQQNPGTTSVIPFEYIAEIRLIE